MRRRSLAAATQSGCLLTGGRPRALQPLGGGIAGRIAADVAPGCKGLPTWPAAAAGSSGGSSADVSAWPRLVAPRTGATAQAAGRVESWPLGGGVPGTVATVAAAGGGGSLAYRPHLKG